MRSLFRRVMNCLTFSRATSNRFCGWKSSASIELDISKAIMMLMPSVFDWADRPAARGRARATTSPAIATLRKTISVLVTPRPARGSFASNAVREKVIAPPGRFLRHHHQAGSTSNSTSAIGLWKSITGKRGRPASRSSNMRGLRGPSGGRPFRSQDRHMADLTEVEGYQAFHGATRPQRRGGWRVSLADDDYLLPGWPLHLQ